MNNDLMQKYISQNPFQQLNEIVFNILADEISSLSLKPGTKLNVSKLADDLNISRTPVREAIMKLCKEGYVKKIPDKTGFYVTDIGIKDIVKIYFIRSMLEGRAAYLCAKNINFASNIDKLKQLTRAFKNPKNDLEQLSKLDFEYHRHIIIASGNEYLLKFFKLIENKINLLQKLNITLDMTDNIINTEKLFIEHSAITNSILLHMPELAEKEMISHVSADHKTVLVFSRDYIRLKNQTT